MMMDRGQQQQQQQQQQQHHHQHSHDGQQQSQSYDPPSQPPRSHLSRSVSYPVPTQNSYSAQLHENMSSSSLPVSHHKSESTTSTTQYAGLGISMQGNDNSQAHLLPSPDSPFSTQLLSRYGGTGQPPTPSFPNLRSSSPASSVWSASDQGTSSSTLSGFIPRLHKMVSDEKYQNLISWNGSGTSFYISQVAEFARTVLPLHFKHNNFSSFVRQLNMYGFHKVNKTPRGYKVAQENQVWEFSHTKFIRHRPDLLDEIKRRQGDVDFIREGDLATHMGLMQVQQNDIMKQLSALQEQVGALVTGLNESRKRQQGQEERLKQVVEYLEKQAQNSPITNVKPILQRKQSMQKPPNRRPSNVARLVLDESIDRRYSISTPTTQDLETFFEGGDTSSVGAGVLGTPPQSSPPASQPSSSGSGRRSPSGAAKALRASAVFSTPSSINTSTTTQYTPASSFSSLSSMQRATTSPALRRNKSMVMPPLPSPNVTPTPSYNYPAQYAPALATIESQSPSQQVGGVMQQELHHSLRPQSSHTTLQAAQPPATYQSAAAPYATPPRLSTLSSSHHQQYTTPQFPMRTDQYIHTESMQLASPASFPTSSMHTFTQQMQQHQQHQQQQQQQRRRRQNSDVTEDMDLIS